MIRGCPGSVLLQVGFRIQRSAYASSGERCDIAEVIERLGRGDGTSASGRFGQAQFGECIRDEVSGWTTIWGLLKKPGAPQLWGLLKGLVVIPEREQRAAMCPAAVPKAQLLSISGKEAATRL